MITGWALPPRVDLISNRSVQCAQVALGKQMDPFEYIMVLVSIIVGLGVTHILAAIGSAIHRIRGHGVHIRLELTYLCWVGTIFIWLITFWWWEFKFSKLDIEWTLGLYLFIIGYAVCLYLTSVVLVPSRMEGVDDSYEYFLKGRKWFFSLMTLVVLFDIVDTYLKGPNRILQINYVVQIFLLLALCVTGAFSKSRQLQLVTAVTFFLVQLVYLFVELRQLG